VQTYVEVGPQGVLSALGVEVLSEERETRFLPVLRKGRSEEASFTGALGALHTRGQRLDWKAYFEPMGARRVELPTYAFQRERHWLDGRKGPKYRRRVGRIGIGRASAARSGGDPGRQRGVPVHGTAIAARAALAIGHAVHGTVLLPGTAFVELALVGAHRVGLEKVKS